jgi:hypothetical protein
MIRSFLSWLRGASSGKHARQGCYQLTAHGKISPSGGRDSSMKRFLGGAVFLGLFVGMAARTEADYSFSTLDVPGAVHRAHAP